MVAPSLPEAFHPMFEWVCPKCDRSVLAELKECPYCGAAESAAPVAVPQPKPAPARPVRRVRTRKAFEWADVERGFRFGLGFLAVLAVGYFLLFGIAFVWNHPEWLDRLTSWMRPH
jgi:hypothetical protein